MRYGSVEKKKFRTRKVWKDKRKEIIRKQEKKDPVTLKPLSKTCPLHHLDLNPDNYEDLSDDSHFAALNKKTHDMIHFLYTYYKKDEDVLVRIKEILDRMKSINS